MLSSSARRLQLTKERQHLTVRKKVRWCRAIPFQHFPKENVIFKNARISIPTTRVFGKYPRVRQICPQMEKLVFLETWKMNWGSAKATNHCGTFICSSACPLCNEHSSSFSASVGRTSFTTSHWIEIITGSDRCSGSRAAVHRERRISRRHGHSVCGSAVCRSIVRSQAC